MTPGRLAKYTPAMRAEYALILDEPAPCDTCPNAELCRFTASACKAFSAYVKGEPWETRPREPDLRIGERLGLKPAEMTDDDRARLLAKVVVK